MTKKYVSDTKAANSISAYVIMKGTRHVATVTAAFSRDGTCLVNVRQDDNGAQRSAKSSGKNVDTLRFQHSSAGGYGYDKFTAALSGLWIDGHKLTNHCGGSKKPPKGHKVWPSDAKEPRGYRFANFQSQYITFGFDPEKHENPHFQGEEGWESCHRIEGLKYLEAIGYTIIQAV